MSATVRASDRKRDLAALALVLVGAVLMLIAHIGMQNLAAGNVTMAKGEWRMNRYNRHTRTSDLGKGFIVAGVLIGVWSLAHHTFHGRSLKKHEEENRS